MDLMQPSSMSNARFTAFVRHILDGYEGKVPPERVFRFVGERRPTSGTGLDGTPVLSIEYPPEAQPGPSTAEPKSQNNSGGKKVKPRKRGAVTFLSNPTMPDETDDETSARPLLGVQTRSASRPVARPSETGGRKGKKKAVEKSEPETSGSESTQSAEYIDLDAPDREYVPLRALVTSEHLQQRGGGSTRPSRAKLGQSVEVKAEVEVTVQVDSNEGGDQAGGWEDGANLNTPCAIEPTSSAAASGPESVAAAAGTPSTNVVLQPPPAFENASTGFKVFDLRLSDPPGAVGMFAEVDLLP
jgi:hypothetical protein